MNQNKVIGTAVLFLLLGTTIPALAQTGQEQKGQGGEKAQPAKQQPQQAKPPAKQQPQQTKSQAKQQPQQTKSQAKQPPQQTKSQAKQQPQQAKSQAKQQPQQTKSQAKQQPQQAKSQAKQQPQAVASNRGNNGNHYGRIPDDRYRANFGHDHSFHMMRPQLIGGYNRFQYGGFSFGFNVGWPSGWDYNDDFYVEYVDGFYYMYNLRHPGIHITLNLF
jgi:hypothetical protein